MNDEFTERRAKQNPDFAFQLHGCGSVGPDGNILWHFWVGEDSLVPKDERVFADAIRLLAEIIEEKGHDGFTGSDPSEHPG